MSNRFFDPSFEATVAALDLQALGLKAGPIQQQYRPGGVPASAGTHRPPLTLDASPESVAALEEVAAAAAARIAARLERVEALALEVLLHGGGIVSVDESARDFRQPDAEFGIHIFPTEGAYEHWLDLHGLVDPRG